MKNDRQNLMDSYNALCASDSKGNVSESYESWLERRLLAKMHEAENQRNLKLISQIFAGKASDIIGFKKTLELMQEAKDAFDQMVTHVPIFPHPLLSIVQEEIIKQDEKWGEQNHPCRNILLTYKLDSPDYYKEVCDERAKVGTVTWADIALEELSEAIYEVDIHKRKEEVIQLAAVCVQWAAKIQRDIEKLKTVEA